MTIDMNKIKNHPGFMPFGSRNIHTSTANTQAVKDEVKRVQEVNHDANLENSNAGGEKR